MAVAKRVQLAVEAHGLIARALRNLGTLDPIRFAADSVALADGLTSPFESDGRCRLWGTRRRNEWYRWDLHVVAQRDVWKSVLAKPVCARRRPAIVSNSANSLAPKN